MPAPIFGFAYFSPWWVFQNVFKNMGLCIYYFQSDNINAHVSSCIIFNCSEDEEWGNALYLTLCLILLTLQTKVITNCITIILSSKCLRLFMLPAVKQFFSESLQNVRA